MKSNDLLLHLYFERDGDQWLAFCLDFTLVAQASSLEEADQKLMSQVRDYLHDATVGEDRAHAKYLLQRRASAPYWAKFYWTLFRQWMRHATMASRIRKAEVQPLPMIPSCPA